MPPSARSTPRTWRRRWAGLAGGSEQPPHPVLYIPTPHPHPRLLSQEKFAKTYGSFKVMYTVGYSVSLCALLLALAVLLGFR